MDVTIRSLGQGTILLDDTDDGVTLEIRELADSIETVGLLLPLLVDGADQIVDGKKRAAALAQLGVRTAPVIYLDQQPTTVVQSAALRGYCLAASVKRDDFGASRSTLMRVDKVLAVAADVTLPATARLTAAEGVTQLSAGAPANAILTQVTEAVSASHVTGRYPELASLSEPDAVRMAAYLDALSDEEQREIELAALRMNATPETDPLLAMQVYTHMQDLAAVVDQDRANEVAAALAAAISGHALTPAMRERALEVADLLDQSARGIRAAMTLELHPS